MILLTHSEVEKYSHLIDVKFNNLTIKRLCYKEVVKQINRKRYNIIIECKCDCGKDTFSTIRDVLYDNILSCGCLHIKHSMTNTPEYTAYCQAKRRCTRNNFSNYHRYGGRGIKFKFLSFEEFFKEVGLRPSNGHSLDRKENEGHYEIGNVRWATKVEQANNKSNRHD